jgi:predicted Zn-dependent protease
MSCVIGSFGCTTVPSTKPVDLVEQSKKDVALGSELSEQLESNLELKTVPETQIFLRKIAAALAAGDLVLKDHAIGVLLIASKTGKWRNFATPGARVYLSIALLQKLQFENEWAAAIALELGHLSARHLQQHAAEEIPDRADGAIHSDQKQKLFGPSGVFNFNESDGKQAIELAVGLLYGAGYDPRGLPALFKTYESHLQRSPYESDTIQRFLEYTRGVISKYAPLRNPIVRTDEFRAAQKRIGRL